MVPPKSALHPLGGLVSTSVPQQGQNLQGDGEKSSVTPNSGPLFLFFSMNLNVFFKKTVCFFHDVEGNSTFPWQQREHNVLQRETAPSCRTKPQPAHSVQPWSLCRGPAIPGCRASRAWAARAGGHRMPQPVANDCSS